jgi:hypothetical protein
MRMDNVTEKEIGRGDVAIIPPGHDAWTVGDEPCVQVDFTGMETYAEKAEGRSGSVERAQRVRSTDRPPQAVRRGPAASLVRRLRAAIR